VAQQPGNPYLAGQIATLQPIPDPDWAFAGWSGPNAGDLADNGDGTWSLTVDGDKALTATFAAGQYQVTITVVGQGQVAQQPGNPYLAGQIATLQPIPDPGWAFAGWSGPNAGDLADNGDGTWSLTVDGDKALTATFGEDEYPIDIYLPLILRDYGLGSRRQLCRPRLLRPMAAADLLQKTRPRGMCVLESTGRSPDWQAADRQHRWVTDEQTN
jgi:hypothetical protein